MAASLHHAVPKLTITTAARPESRWLSFNSVRCCAPTTTTTTTDAGAHRITVKNGNDSLDICRVLNGMWQTSGGWGRIDRDDAVEAMLRYADAGLSTFDMADHCKLFKTITLFLWVFFMFTWCVLIGLESPGPFACHVGFLSLLCLLQQCPYGYLRIRHFFLSICNNVTV